LVFHDAEGVAVTVDVDFLVSRIYTVMGWDATQKAEGTVDKRRLEQKL
jgi:hypothetical protein